MDAVEFTGVTVDRAAQAVFPRAEDFQFKPIVDATEEFKFKSVVNATEEFLFSLRSAPTTCERTMSGKGSQRANQIC